MRCLAILILPIFASTVLASDFDINFSPVKKPVSLFGLQEQPKLESSDSGPAEAQEQPNQYKHSPGPIGVMGNHTHKAGKVMFSYRFMQMEMRGLKEGTKTVEKSDVLKDYLATPTDMSTTMHMFGLMWAPTDDVTLAMMGKLITKRMDITNRMGMESTIRSSGLGDLKIGALVSAMKLQGHQAHLNFSLSLPTGAINAANKASKVMGYPMQLGTGSVGVSFGGTYTGKSDIYNWGAQAVATFQTHRNYRDYRIGNRLHATGWFAVEPLRWVSFSGRLAYKVLQGIVGEDPELNTKQTPGSGTDNRGRWAINASLGTNIFVRKNLLPNNILAGQRISFEVTVPVMQSVNGMQLASEWGVMLGWIWTF